ncbi:hypothetical protein CEUSTIGMA_g103.t1 [Chlamydomonas eustigma]|uniref:C2 domain-containing protein n=1 Tax=Chlamydomonas eustigma TaxID=1157962 RepID=A0A250WP86_9CHLO|nr:hypothetical protein CEUSTIGMA_g103.t1 [Chlamydomonas eustigma]|eukprot:GAX72647.1 hypothetical protein CEUSTIGMA_g103.t1 [Chlamydomonas eustigma]
MGFIFSVPTFLRADDEVQLIRAQFTRRPALYLGTKKQNAYEIVRHISGQEPSLHSSKLDGSPRWIDIGLSCSGLPCADMFSLSDPMAVLYERIESTGAWRERGRTEVILNNEDPVFLQRIRILYRPGYTQQLRLVLVDLDGDVDAELVDATTCDFLGEAKDFTLHELVSAPNSKLELPLDTEEEMNIQSFATLTAEVVAQPRGTVSFQVGLYNLPESEHLNPVLEVMRQAPVGRWACIYKSEVCAGSSVEWWPIKLDLSLLDNGQDGAPIQMRVSSLGADGHPVLIGLTIVTTETLASAAGTGRELVLTSLASDKEELHNSTLRLASTVGSGNGGIRTYLTRASATISNTGASMAKASLSHLNRISLQKRSGTPKSNGPVDAPVPHLKVLAWEQHNESSLLERLKKGPSLQVAVAIDFTKTNLQPEQPGSLHFLLGQAGTLTKYEEVMWRISRILSWPQLSQQRVSLATAALSTSSTMEQQQQQQQWPPSLDLSLAPSGSAEALLGKGGKPISQVTPASSFAAVVGGGHQLNPKHKVAQPPLLVFGFGGHQPGQLPVACFPLTRHPGGVCMGGMNELFRSYRHSLASWRLSSQRLLGPLISQVAHLAETSDREAAALHPGAYTNTEAPEVSGAEASALSEKPPGAPSLYTILIILTNGPPLDIKETIDTVSHSGGLPMSIVVVNVAEEGEGEDDARLQMLDYKIRRTHDGRQLSLLHTFLSHLNGKFPVRDNVHYVRYSHHPPAGDASDEELLMDIFLELSDQYSEFCSIREKTDENADNMELTLSEANTLGEETK